MREICARGSCTGWNISIAMLLYVMHSARALRRWKSPMGPGDHSTAPYTLSKSLFLQGFMLPVYDTGHGDGATIR